MKLTGKMLDSFYIKKKFNLKGFRYKMGFTDKKAVYHNTEGAGRSKVLRRLLPTRLGETFSRYYNDMILSHIDKAIKKVLRFNK